VVKKQALQKRMMGRHSIPSIAGRTAGSAWDGTRGPWKRDPARFPSTRWLGIAMVIFAMAVVVCCFFQCLPNSEIAVRQFLGEVKNERLLFLLLSSCALGLAPVLEGAELSWQSKKN